MVPYLDRFAEYLVHEQNRSSNTVTAYISDLHQFAAFITSGRPEEFHPEDMDSSDIRTWLAALGRAGEKTSSIRRKTQSVRAFFHFLCKRGIMADNPARRIVLAKLPHPLPHFIREDEMEDLLHKTDIGILGPDTEISAIRDHLVLHLLYATGMRQAEARALTDADFNPLRRELRIFGKGRKERVMPLADELCAEIARWQTIRDAVWPALETPRPILTMGRGPISQSSFSVIVKRLLGGTSTDRKSPHTLRHTFATAMLNGGADLDSVRQLLGHSSIATTQIYTHLSMAEIRNAYFSAHPRCKTGEADKKSSEE